MDLERLLTEQRPAVLVESFAALQRSGAVHYGRAGEAFTKERLADLFDVVLSALRDRELEPVKGYCEALAQRRFEAGFGISEVQTAFNTLEEAMWKRLITGMPLDEVVPAIGLLSTVLGLGKDTLASRYVALASQRHAPALDLAAMVGEPLG